MDKFSLLYIMDFVVVIPSYKRASTLKTKTLKLLKDKNIPRENIYIFVADEEEYKIYLNEIGTEYKIVVGIKGILNQRNFIIDYFDEGENIISIDDDIEDIKELNKENQLESVDLLKLINNSFKLIKQHKLTFWGITLISNKTWMKHNINTNLGIAPAGFYGFINDKTMKNSIDNFSREDVERSINYFIKEGALMRYQNIMMKTKMKAGKGGIQTDYDFNERKQQEALYDIELIKKYGDYISLLKTKIGIKVKNIKSNIKINFLTDRGSGVPPPNDGGERGLYPLCDHPENKLCSYVASFDDWFFNTWIEIAEFANALKIPLTFFVSSTPYYYEIYSINIKIASKRPDIDVKKETKKLLEAGNEIGYHSCNHMDMKKENDEYIEKDILNWKTIMGDDGLIKDINALTGAYPYGHLPEKMDLIKKHFVSMRGTGYGLTDKPSFNTKTINIGQKTTIEKLNNELNKTIENNSTMIISGHSTNNEGWSPIDKNILYDHWKSIDTNKVACMTYQDYFKYYTQKKNMTIELVNNKLIIKHNLNFKLVPIYIDVGNKVFYQNGKQLNSINGILKIDNFNDEITGGITPSQYEFVIVIPSYKRHKTLNNKTLNLLRNSDVPKEIIHIFVADEEEYKLYLNEIGTEYKIIIGKHTLKHQRNFINDYFDEGQKIISLDDDLSKIVSGHKVSKTDKIKLEITSLMDVFKNGFNECKIHNSYIFGFHPCSNLFYMSPGLSTTLKYIIGSAYGYINRRMSVYTDDKEDFERTLQHYIKDGVVLRFNYISFVSRYYKEKGGLQETRTLETIKQGAEYIHTKYPEYTRIKIKKNGIYEIDLLTKPKYVHIDTSVKRYKMPQESKELINVIYEKLKNITLPTLAIAQYSGCKNKKRRERGDKLIDIETIKKLKTETHPIGDQTIPRTLNIGFGNNRSKDCGILRPTLHYKELFDLLVELGKKIIPNTMTFNAITINQNIKCKKHKDASNCGPSVFFTIGEFSGGGLYVEDVLYNNCNEYITIFDGALKEHYTEDFVGNRYSFIFYNSVIYKCSPEHIYKGELIK